jgi:hypothetical protein
MVLYSYVILSYYLIGLLYCTGHLVYPLYALHLEEALPATRRIRDCCER